MSRKYFIRIKKVSNDQNNLTKTAQMARLPPRPRTPPAPATPPATAPAASPTFRQLSSNADHIRLMKEFKLSLEQANRLKYEVLGGSPKFNPKENGLFLTIMSAVSGIASSVVSGMKIPGISLFLTQLSILGGFIASATLFVDAMGSAWARWFTNINRNWEHKNIDVLVLERKEQIGKNGQATFKWEAAPDDTLSMEDIFEHFHKEGARVRPNEGAWVVDTKKYVIKDQGKVDELNRWCTQVNEVFAKRAKAKGQAKVGAFVTYAAVIAAWVVIQQNRQRAETLQYGEAQKITDTDTVILNSITDAKNRALDSQATELYNQAISKLYPGRTPNAAEKDRDRIKIEKIIDYLNKDQTIRDKAKAKI